MNRRILLVVFWASSLSTTGLAQSQAQTANRGLRVTDYDVFNRTIDQVAHNGKPAIRFSEGPDSGIAWLKGVTFSEGTIEFDAKGRDVFQKSFLGIAFHGVDNKTYESVYFRPFNFQSSDPVRKVHAVQYISVPKFDFQTLRDTRKDEFEAAIVPGTVQATDWFHARVEVRNDRIRVFVNDATTPCLDVPSLNPDVRTGMIGFWVGNNSDGEFTNLAIKK